MAGETEIRGIVLTDSTGTERLFEVISVGEQGMKALDLYETKLRDLPDGLFKLDELEVLYLNVVDMGDLPESVQKLEKLSALYMSRIGAGAGLRTFPAAVTKISRLTSLGLFGNVNLTCFPDGICCHLKRLQKLYLQMCRINLLPSDFGEMTELRYFDIRDNPAHNLSEAVMGLQNLQCLGLESERLGDFIDKAPRGLRASITTLRMECNSTSMLPRQLLYLESLDTLYLETEAGEVSNSFPVLRHHLQSAASRDNDLVVPPVEVLNGGQGVINSYYQSLTETSMSRQKRVKVLLNGKSMAGKTSLVNAIQVILSVSESSRNQTMCCLTGVEDRTVSVEQRQLQLGDVEMRINDTGGHDVYSLTNQLVTTDNSLIITVIDSSKYQMTEKQFHDQVGKYLHVVFDLLVKAVIVLVLSKIDSCERNTLTEYVGHITRQVEEHVKEREMVSRRERLRDQKITICKTIILTSAKTLEGISNLVECIDAIVHQPDFIPSVERILPQSWVFAEDALTETAVLLHPPICTMQEAMTLLSGLQTRITEDTIPYLLTYLHQVGSVLHFSSHRVLRNYLFPNSHFVVDLLKTLYHHNVMSLTLPTVDEEQCDSQSNVTDIEFERMKKELTENGSVGVQWVQVIWSKFNLKRIHHDLLLNLMFKFDLAYPKCADEEIHAKVRELTDSTDEGTVAYCSDLTSPESADVNLLNADVQGGALNQLALLRQFLSDDTDECQKETLLSTLQTTGTQLLLPWFLRDEKPSGIPDMSSAFDDYVQIVSTYAFRYHVPVGLFDRLSARCSRHAIYSRHWKSGLYFTYGPVEALFQCEATRPSPNIALTFRAPKSTNNPKRLCHAMWRCIQDMEDLLKTLPGVAVSRYLSREILTERVVELGVRQTVAQPATSGPSFTVQESACGPAGITEDLLDCLKEVAGHPLISCPLSKLFSSRCGEPITSDHIKQFARELSAEQNTNVWTDVADALDLSEDLIDELSKSIMRTRLRRMLQTWKEQRPHCALVCVLCDILYTEGLKAVADRLFDPDTFVDRILRSSDNQLDGRNGTPAKRLRTEESVTSQHVDIIVRHCSEDWKAMGRVLLGYSDTEVLDFVSHLPTALGGNVRNSDKLRCLIDKWLENERDEAMVSNLLQACDHPDIYKRGGVEVDMKTAGLLPGV